MNTEALEKIKKGRVQLLINQPFFGALALRLKLVEDATVETMGTDGTRLLYNPAFVLRLSMPEIIGVLCHEVLHCANAHHTRQNKRNARIWNYACDYAINPLINDAKASIGGYVPSPCLFEEKYRGWSAERIYDDLLSSGQCTQNASGQAVDGQGQPLPSTVGEVLPCAEGQEANETQAWQVATRQAAIAAKMQGKLPQSMQSLVDTLVEPQVDWRSLLWDFVQSTTDKSDYTWKIPSSRYAHAGLYLPTMHGETCPPIALTIDTSGSISQKEVIAFLSEIQSVIDTVKPEKVIVLQADAQVQHTAVYLRGESLNMQNFKVYGHGGTDFRPAFAYLHEKEPEVVCHVYLTDMEGTFPEAEPEMPTLWVSTQRGKHAPFGTVVELHVD